MSNWDKEKEDAYQRWKKWGIFSDDFIPLEGRGCHALIRDSKTGLVWDSVEFQERDMQEEVVDAK